jgi:tetratricopeptide (TPR) repeat protein
MAHIYTQEGRWDKAISEYKKLIVIEPEDFNSYSMLGDVYVKKGEVQPAFDAFLLCSDAYLRLGQLEKAALAQGKIARLAPEPLNAESRKKQLVFRKQMEADKILDMGDMDKAVEAYQAVLSLDPDRFDLYQKLGDLYLRKGDVAAACVKYKEIGDIYLKNRLIKKAAPLFQKIVELEPENVDAHAALADIHSKAGNESEAKKELLLLAEFLFQKGDLDRAFVFAQKAEQLKAIESYNYLGHVELRRGKREEARSWFEKLLKFKLSHGGALWGISLVQSQEGRPDEALKTLGKVPKTDRFYGEALAALADVEVALGQGEAAGRHYREAVEILKSKGATVQAAAAEAAAARFAQAPQAPAPEKAAPAGPAPQKQASVAPTSTAAVDGPLAQPAAPAPPKPVAPQPPAPAPPVQPPSSTPSAAPESAPAQAAGPLQAAAIPAAPAPQDPRSEAREKEAGEAGEDTQSLLTLADNFEAEGSLDEALGIYQRILVLDAGSVAAREGMSRVYRLLAGSAPPQSPSPAPAAPAVSTPAPVPVPAAGPDPAQLVKLAALKAQAEAAQREAKADVDARRVQQEQELERVESERRRLDEEARLRKEAEALKAAELEARRRSEEAAEQARAMKKQMEIEIRAQLEEEMRKRTEEEAARRAEETLLRKEEEAVALRVREDRHQEELKAARGSVVAQEKPAEAGPAVPEAVHPSPVHEVPQAAPEAVHPSPALEAPLPAPGAPPTLHQGGDDADRRQAEVLARVQAQQDERQAPLRRIIEETRRKAEEHAALGAATEAVGAPPVPHKADEELDEMDDFMTSAVADIYVKQGLKVEAQKIYERILKREPGNGDVRAKLDALLGRTALPGPEAGHKPEPPAAPKKSKVSYL